MNYLRYGFFALVIGYVAYTYFGGTKYVEDEIDLNQVLDVTVETIYAFQDKTANLTPDENAPDQAFLDFSDDLQAALNIASPEIYTQPIAVQPNGDASLLAYVETNGNQEFDQDSEEALFMIEVDGENSRVIATSRSGAVNDTRISGTGLLTGYLIGSMLSRQRAAGVNTSQLANKKTVSPRQAARSRAGSGSHSRGK